MNEALFARSQMAVSLGFHIVFAAVGIAMPVLMVLAEILARRTGDPVYMKLARKWAKGTAVLFAVGAVSGTVLSFELGLLFPRFMAEAGAIIGMPFSLEGFAFFTEAIFLGIYLYGFERVRPSLHIGAGVLVALSGLLSAVFVTFVNAWMNAPTGVQVSSEGLILVDTLGALRSPFALHEILHNVLACYIATAFAVAAMHAYGLLKQPNSVFHLHALKLALLLAVPTALAQPFVGHFAGQQVATHQPLKLAAMEGLIETQARAPVSVGPLSIPGGLSFLSYGDVDAVVRGLEEFPREDWPHGIVRIAFQVMVVIGSLLSAYAALVVLLWLRKRPFTHKRFLQATLLLGPLGLVAMEAGWIVTEVGRQPFVIYGILRTHDAVTPMPGLLAPFLTFCFVYALLAGVVLMVLLRQLRETTEAPP